MLASLLETPPHELTRWVFLRLVAGLYFIAFSSLAVQVTGLVGERGILPANLYLDAIQRNYGAARYATFPTLAWINSSDTALRVLCFGGMLSSLLAFSGVLAVPAFGLAWVFYLSLLTVGQDFLSFQWDILLIETGVLAILFAMRGPSRIVLWLLFFLVFRLMFESGTVKLLSGDRTWRDLTALSYHYETQPLPTPVAWYVHQLPAWFQKASTAGMFAVELGLPFLVFAPGALRVVAACGLIGFQLMIAVTGNYTFFNLLTIVLCLTLFDDSFYGRVLPQGLVARITSQTDAGYSSVRTGVFVTVAVFVIIAGIVQLLAMFKFAAIVPRPVARLSTFIEGLHVVNRYGLFSIMTTARPEIIIEGSDDSTNWRAYEFKYKAGDVNRRPRWVAPHQPRLDWQMWFAAMGSYNDFPWISNLLVRLLEGSPPVLALLAHNPFPDHPPRYIRALVYDYKFTDFETRRRTGAWWRREYLGVYFPAASLRN